MTKMNKKSGFSMLELVVVMLIMGTLAGIAISKMGGSDIGAIKASVKADTRGAIARVNACYADKLDYTICDDAVIKGTGGTGTAKVNASLIPSPVASTGATVTIGVSRSKADFPLITVSNTMGTTDTSDDFTLYYDADLHSSLSTDAANQVNP